MKRIQLLVLSALVAGLQASAAQATFPSDGEASYDLPALETYADRMTRIGQGGDVAVVTPEVPASVSAADLPALETYADRMARIGNTDGAEVWGVSRRQVEPHNPFPFGGGPVDD